MHHLWFMFYWCFCFRCNFRVIFSYIVPESRKIARNFRMFHMRSGLLVYQGQCIFCYLRINMVGGFRRKLNAAFLLEGFQAFFKCFVFFITSIKTRWEDAEFSVSLGMFFAFSEIFLSFSTSNLKKVVLRAFKMLEESGFFASMVLFFITLFVFRITIFTGSFPQFVYYPCSPLRVYLCQRLKYASHNIIG